MLVLLAAESGEKARKSPCSRVRQLVSPFVASVIPAKAGIQVVESVTISGDLGRS
jgi:hypothetical protein